MKYRPHATHPRRASLLQFTFAFVLGMMALSLCGTAAAQDTRYKLVSPAFAEGQSADQHSFGPVISADGRFIAFTSQASNLVSFPTSGSRSAPGEGIIKNAFVRDVQNGTTELVSVNSAGTGSGNGTSSVVSISADGRFVKFVSTSSDLVADDPNGSGTNLFVRDLLAHTTTLADAPPDNGAAGEGGSLVREANDSGTRLYVRDPVKGTLKQLSAPSLEFPRVFRSFGASTVSADGRYVIFAYSFSFFHALAGEVPKSNVGRYDTLTDTITLLPETDACLNGPALCMVTTFPPSVSADGRFVAFAQKVLGNSISERGYLGDFVNHSTTSVFSQGQFSFNHLSPSFTPAVSADGRSVAFVTILKLLPQDTNSFFDVYRFDREGTDPEGVNGVIHIGQPAFRAEEGGGSVTIPVLRSAFAATGPATVEYFTSNLTATAGSDYTATSGTLTFADGEDVKFVTVPILNDDVHEGTQIFSLNLRNPTGGYTLVNAGHGTQIFIHDSIKPTITISDATTTEGGDAVFNVTLSAPHSFLYAVQFSTDDDTAQSSDYTSKRGTLFFDPGLFGPAPTTGTIVVHTARDSNTEPDEKFFLNLSPVTDDFTIVRAQAVGTIADDPSPVVKFVPAGANFFASEADGSATITVRRTAGDPSIPFSVNYATSDGTASERSDYIAALGRLDFAAGETVKTFQVLLIDDAYMEQLSESVTLTLSEPTGGAVLGNGAPQLFITSNDNSPPASNPIDDARFFVAQHYRDFLNRAPDTAGLDFWTSELNRLTAACESRPTAEARAGCVLIARAQISTAFFLSIEFQQTSYEVIRFYRATFARAPTLREFLADAQEISRDVRVGAPGWEAKLEANRQKFADEWVQRPAFRAAFDTASNSEYVRRLFTNGAGDANAEPALQAALVSGLGAGGETRATALRKAAGSGSVFNRQYNPAFVLMQYFGYMRRNPADPPDTGLGGFNFWLTKLDQFSLAGEDMRDPDAALSRIRRAQMVESFIDSIEYRNRFGP